MKKSVVKDNVYYDLAWSPFRKYDKYEAIRVLPELSGIVALAYPDGSRMKYVLFHTCWRDGCRVGLRKLLDPTLSRMPELTRQIDTERIYYKYAVAEGNFEDVRDVLFWLFKTYQPLLNNSAGFRDSQRYMNISVREIELDKDSIVEKF